MPRRSWYSFAGGTDGSYPNAGLTAVNGTMYGTFSPEHKQRAIAVSRRLLRGEVDDVVKRIDTETMLFRERLQSDEARAAFTAFLGRRK